MEIQQDSKASLPENLIEEPPLRMQVRRGSEFLPQQQHFIKTKNDDVLFEFEKTYKPKTATNKDVLRVVEKKQW